MKPVRTPISPATNQAYTAMIDIIEPHLVAQPYSRQQAVHAMTQWWLAHCRIQTRHISPEATQ